MSGEGILKRGEDRLDGQDDARLFRVIENQNEVFQHQEGYSGMFAIVSKEIV